jgi:peroxiredoxin
MPRLRTLSVLFVLLVSASIGAARPQTLAELRDAFGIPAGAKVVYQAEDGKTLTEQEFATLFGKSANASLAKDDAKGVYTLSLGKAGGVRKPPPVVDLPPFDFTDLGGKRIRDADLAGKKTIVSFFFEACVPCIREVPAFNAFRRKHPEYNYVAVTFDDAKAAGRFVQQHKFEWPVVAGAQAFIESAGIKAFPTYLLLDEAGAVIDADNGFNTTQGEAAAVAGLEQWMKVRAEMRPWEPLLDDKLSQFDIWLSYHGSVIRSVLDGKAPKTLQPRGLNPPDQNVFSVSNEAGKPQLRITGEWYGCLNTKRIFSNFHLVAKVKWGDKKWVPRLDEPKDSGILYHSRGPFGVDYWKSWALSQEFQVIEHGHGEYWSQSTSAIDIRANPKKAGEEAPRWDPKAPWMTFGSEAPGNNHALAGSDEDKPGEWNTLELVCIQDGCVHVVNGKVVMALANSRYKVGEQTMPMTGGTLQIQSEAAEVFYRDIAIRVIPVMPKEYDAYFH